MGCICMYVSLYEIKLYYYYYNMRIYYLCKCRCIAGNWIEDSNFTDISLLSLLFLSLLRSLFLFFLLINITIWIFIMLLLFYWEILQHENFSCRAIVTAGILEWIISWIFSGITGVIVTGIMRWTSCGEGGGSGGERGAL